MLRASHGRWVWLGSSSSVDAVAADQCVGGAGHLFLLCVEPTPFVRFSREQEKKRFSFHISFMMSTMTTTPTTTTTTVCQQIKILVN